METKTIYVPIEQVLLLPEFLSVYHNGAGRIDLVKEDMIVMTKDEFETVKKEAYNHGHADMAKFVIKQLTVL